MCAHGFLPVPDVRRSVSRIIHPMWAFALAVFACSDHAIDVPQRPWPLETAIARELTGRFASPATARCDFFGIVPACSAAVLDIQLPIRVSSDGIAWTWRV